MCFMHPDFSFLLLIGPWDRAGYSRSMENPACVMYLQDIGTSQCDPRSRFEWVERIEWDGEVIHVL